MTYIHWDEQKSKTSGNFSDGAHTSVWTQGRIPVSVTVTGESLGEYGKEKSYSGQRRWQTLDTTGVWSCPFNVDSKCKNNINGTC